MNKLPQSSSGGRRGPPSWVKISSKKIKKLDSQKIDSPPLTPRYNNSTVVVSTITRLVAPRQYSNHLKSAPMAPPLLYLFHLHVPTVSKRTLSCFQ